MKIRSFFRKFFRIEGAQVSTNLASVNFSSSYHGGATFSSNSVGMHLPGLSGELSSNDDLSLVVTEESAGYETRSIGWFLKFPFAELLLVWVAAKRFLMNLTLGHGPKTNSFFFDGLGRKCRELKEAATTWRALDIVYNLRSVNSEKGVSGFVDRFWWKNAMNGMAVRNRLKLVKKLLSREIAARPESEVRIASLACGAAQGLLEAIHELGECGKSVKILLVDISADAIEAAKKTADKYGIAENISVFNGSVRESEEACVRFAPHIVEMIGLMDYLTQEKAIAYAEMIKRILAPRRGVYLVCNIVHNVEKYFTTVVMNWPMIYRTPEEIADVGVSAGYKENIVHLEPLSVHGILAART